MEESCRVCEILFCFVPLEDFNFSVSSNSGFSVSIVFIFIFTAAAAAATTTLCRCVLISGGNRSKQETGRAKVCSIFDLILFEKAELSTNLHPQWISEMQQNDSFFWILVVIQLRVAEKCFLEHFFRSLLSLFFIQWLTVVVTDVAVGFFGLSMKKIFRQNNSMAFHPNLDRRNRTYSFSLFFTSVKCFVEEGHLLRN